jgi:hypothetical protein
MTTDIKNADKPSNDWVVITTEFDGDDTLSPRGTLMAVWSDPDDEAKAQSYYNDSSPYVMIGLEPWSGRARLFASYAEAGAAFRAEYGKLSKPWKVVRLTNWESMVARSNADDFYNGYWDDDGNPIGPSGAPGTAVEKVADAEIEGEVELTRDEAKALTERIRVQAENLWADITTAYEKRAWAVLGYETWDAYTTGEFGSLRLRLPREERQEVVCSLRESGMPIRAIASATGADAKTVQSDLKSAAVGNSYTSPTTVTGLDGKQHPATKPTTPHTKPVTYIDLTTAMLDNPTLSAQEIQEKFGGTPEVLAKAAANVHNIQAGRAGMGIGTEPVISADELARQKALMRLEALAIELNIVATEWGEQWCYTGVPDEVERIRKALSHLMNAQATFKKLTGEPA